MKRVALIVVFSGKIPEWIELYVETCKLNPTIDWLFFSFEECSAFDKAKNLHHYRLTDDELVNLVKEKIGARIVLNEKAKICDLRPMYGLLFEEFLKGYDFWGHADVDVLWGGIRKFITEDVLSAYQIISAHKKNLCGHFTLYKNIESINCLYQRYPGYKELLESVKCECFDEEGMSELVLKLSKEKKLDFLGGEFVLDDDIPKEWFLTRGYSETECRQIKRGEAYWKEGRIFHAPSNTEMAYFHFHTWKWKWRFISRIKLNQGTIKRITVNKRGFEIDYGAHRECRPNFPERILGNTLAISGLILRAGGRQGLKAPGKSGF